MIASAANRNCRKLRVSISLCNIAVSAVTIPSNMSSSKSISIIVPTRNEAENVAPLVSQIVASAVPFREILFVDNDSTDGTRNVIRSLAAIHPIRLIDQDPAEPGLAAAILSGARGAEGGGLLLMDAE